MTMKEVLVGAKKRPVPMEFPIYRKHKLGAYTIYARIDEDFAATSITMAETGNIFGIEFEEAYLFDQSPIAFHLGLGDYGCSADEFSVVVNQLKQAISRL